MFISTNLCSLEFRYSSYFSGMSNSMNFSQRLIRYLIGMGIGLALVFVIFGPRGCGKWLPGNQVKKWIRENNANIEISEEANCQMNCQELLTDDILYTLSEDGDGKVLFEESQTKGYPKTYVIQSNRGDSVAFKFGFVLRQDSSSVVSFAERIDKPFNCDCSKK